MYKLINLKYSIGRIKVRNKKNKNCIKLVSTVETSNRLVYAID